MLDLVIELAWSVGIPFGVGAVVILTVLRLVPPYKPRPPDPEHIGATEEWSPTGEYVGLAPLDPDDADLHEEFKAIEQRMSADLDWVQATTDEWLGDQRDPAVELAYLGFGDTCGWRKDPITGEFTMVPIGGRQ
jgi:hypothetical protein